MFVRFLFLLFCGLSAIQLSAQSVVDFTIDLQEVQAELEQLNQLESYLEQHPTTTLEILSSSNPDLTFGLMAADSSMRATEYRDPIFNVSAFNFAAISACAGSCAGVGFITGPAAIVIVYTDKGSTKTDTRQAWLGCMAGNAPVTLITGLYIALVVAVNMQEF